MVFIDGDHSLLGIAVKRLNSFPEGELTRVLVNTGWVRTALTDHIWSISSTPHDEVSRSHTANQTGRISSFESCLHMCVFVCRSSLLAFGCLCQDCQDAILFSSWWVLYFSKGGVPRKYTLLTIALSGYKGAVFGAKT